MYTSPFNSKFKLNFQFMPIFIKIGPRVSLRQQKARGRLEGRIAKLLGPVVKVMQTFSVSILVNSASSGL